MDVQRIVKIFLASPMDLSEERNVFKKVIDKINRFIGKTNNISYEVVGWEDYSMPDLGEDAQDIVNHQIKLDYDIFVCLFKNRIGTPTKRSKSGTVEEYERAKTYRISKADLNIMAYFIAPTGDVNPEINEIKNKMSSDGALFWEVQSAEEFENIVFRHFSEKLVNLIKNKSDDKQLSAAVDNAPKMKNSVSVALLNDKNEILIVQRAFSSKVGAGLWQLPGGKIDGGESCEDAAVREIFEELGLRIEADGLQMLYQFDTCLSNDKAKPFKMTLFIYRLGKCDRVITLNGENNAYEWIELSGYNVSKKRFLGINEQMLAAVWREVYLTSSLRYLLEVTAASPQNNLPEEFPSLTDSQTNMLYAFLSLLGVVQTGDGFRFATAYGRKLIEEFVYILSSGSAIFDDSQSDELENVRLPVEDMKQLALYQKSGFHSSRALVAYLSCKATMPHSTRNVCDTLIFGDYNGKKYILMRWDFFAEKYQIVCSGLPDNVGTYEEKARRVIAKRIPSTESYFHYQFIKSITVHHFSAGSVDNDPILRRYDIDIVLLNAIQKYEDDVLRAIQAINYETYQQLVLGYGVGNDKKIDLKYFVWCEVEQLLADNCSYGGNKVRGIEEIIRNIGVRNFVELGKQSLALEESMIDPTFFDECKRMVKENLNS